MTSGRTTVGKTASPGCPVGRGRSAIVYRDVEADGSEYARKVFVPDTASTLVFYVLEGAPNPYSWCREAVETAVVRREVVAALLQFWFGDRLRLARAHGFSFNQELKAFELRSEFVTGHHLPLRGPTQSESPDRLQELTRKIMRPLQQHLIDAGLDGLVWQAGLGNPVATSNFMLESVQPGAPARWVWVDLESGVPALFALDPRAQLSFYLPRSVRLRRGLFDDVDVPRLRRYVLENTDELEESVGSSALKRLLAAVDQLDRCQSAWKCLNRIERGVRSSVVAGRLSQEQGEYFERHPLHWTAHRTRAAVGCGIGAAASLLRRGLRAVLGFDYPKAVAATVRYATSQRYRAYLSRRYVVHRLRDWRTRGFLDSADTLHLRHEMRRDGVSAHLTDFGVHILLKPCVKGVQWGVAPAAFAAGLLSGGMLAVILVGAGAIVRTLYTLGRMIQASARGEPLPWIALGVGVLPVVGNAAYPSQILASRVENSNGLARFLLNDTFARLGRSLPIWGGPDTLTEHALNRVPDWLCGLAPNGRKSDTSTGKSGDGDARVTAAQQLSSPRTIRVSLGRLASRALWGCVALALLFAGLDYTINYLKWADDRSLRRIFNVAREGSMPSWFSSTLLLGSGFVAVLVVFLLKAQRRPRMLRLGWCVIASFFVFMAVDDAAEIHERVGSALKRYFEEDPETHPALVRSLLALPSYAWQAFLLPIFGAVGLFMTVFLWGELGRFRLRRYAVIGMSCFVTAVAMDYVEGLDGSFERAAAWAEVRVYAVSHCSKVTEETFEMVGAAFFLVGFLHYLGAISEGHRILLASSKSTHVDDEPVGFSMTMPRAFETDIEPEVARTKEPVQGDAGGT